jgi:hypothetical protein
MMRQPRIAPGLMVSGLLGVLLAQDVPTPDPPTRKLVAEWSALNAEFERQFDANGELSGGHPSAETCARFESRYAAVRRVFAEMQSARKEYYQAALVQVREDQNDFSQLTNHAAGPSPDLQTMHDQASRDLAAYMKQRADLEPARTNKQGPDDASVRQAARILDGIIEQVQARLKALQSAESDKAELRESSARATATLVKREAAFRDSLAAIPKLTTAYDIYFRTRWSRYRLGCLGMEGPEPCVATPGSQCP